MAARPNEPLSPLELVALALAHAGATDCDAADRIPQPVWDELDERGLICTSVSYGGDGQTDSTPAGDGALFEYLEFLEREPAR